MLRFVLLFQAVNLFGSWEFGELVWGVELMSLFLRLNEDIGLVIETFESEENEARVSQVECSQFSIIEHTNRSCGTPRILGPSQTKFKDIEGTDGLDGD